MKPLSIAHRGGAGEYPENTLHAFAHAMATRCDGAELDVQLTRDGALVVVHDYRLNPYLCRRNGEWWTGPRLRIRDLTLVQLHQFDVGRPKPKSVYALTHSALTPHDGERMPLFAEVLDLIGGRDFRLLVEIKTAWHDRTLSGPPEAVADAALAVLREKNFLDRATLVSFDWAALLHARKMESRAPCWFLTLPPGHVGWKNESAWAAGFEPSRYGSVANAIAAAGGQGRLAFYADATADAVAETHALGLKIGVWNLNDEASIRAYAARGVDAICSDYPTRLVTTLRTAPSKDNVRRTRE